MATPTLVVTVIGLPEAQARIGALSGPNAARVLARATLAGGLIVQTDAAKHAAVKTGTLRRSIHEELTSSSRLGATVTVGTDVKYARAIEEGTRPHTIYPRNAKALWWPGARHPVRSVRHPGMPARPYLVPALTRNVERIKATILAAIEQLLSSG